VSDLLTIEQVAEVLQVSTRTVRRAIESRGLRACQIAGRGTWRVRRADLDAWLEERASTPRPRSVDVTPVALAAARPRAARRGTGVLTVTPGMGRRAS
jgi:excisionase family DNA binding protein